MELYYVIATAIVWLFLAPAILSWLWNMTMPDVFEWRAISYWQAFRLILIVAILTGGAQFKYGS